MRSSHNPFDTGFRYHPKFRRALSPATVALEVADDILTVGMLPEEWQPAPEEVLSAAAEFKSFAESLPVNPMYSAMRDGDQAIGYVLGAPYIERGQRHIVALSRAYEAADALAWRRAEELRLGRRARKVGRQVADVANGRPNIRGIRRQRVVAEAVRILERLRTDDIQVVEQRRLAFAEWNVEALLTGARQLQGLAGQYSIAGPKHHVFLHFFVRRLTEIYCLSTGLKAVFSDSRSLDRAQKEYENWQISYLRLAFAAVGLPAQSSFDHLLREMGKAGGLINQNAKRSPSEPFEIKYSSLPSVGLLIDYSLRAFYRPKLYPPSFSRPAARFDARLRQPFT